MRILHLVTNADLGGAPRVVTELANRAVAEGHACAAASVPEGPFWEHLDPRVERRPLRRLRREISPIDDLRALFEIRGLLKDWKPDIVHLHSSKIGVLGRLAAGRLRSRTVYTIHGFDTILKSHRVFLPLERILAGACGAIVPVSAYDRENLEAAGIRGRIQLIENGVSDRRGREPLDSEAAGLIRNARARGESVVLCVARLAPPKRFDLFVEVARRLQREPARFFWIGNVGTPPELPGGLPPNLELLGELAEAGDYGNLADLFVLFSDYEGLPMSLLEAASCGLALVASEVGGIQAFLSRAGGTGVVNEAGSAATAVEALLRDPGARSRAGAAARAAYEAGHSAAAMWEAYKSLYRELSSSS